MQERAIKKITIDEIVFEVKEWITGRESEYIEAPIIEATSMRMTIVDGQPAPSLDSFNNKAISESVHRAVESVVVSINGEKEGVLDKILDLKKDTYERVLKMVDDIVKKK